MISMWPWHHLMGLKKRTSKRGTAVDSAGSGPAGGSPLGGMKSVGIGLGLLTLLLVLAQVLPQAILAQVQNVVSLAYVPAGPCSVVRACRVP